KAISSNARLITATNAYIDDLVDENEFREDLFYRLDVFRITMPPLRKRYGDIPLLVEKFILRYNQALEKNIVEIAPECIQLLESYDWPGNVRELKNVIQRAVLVCEGEEILPEHIPPRFQSDASSLPTVTFEMGTPLDEVEREMILRALAISNNNRTQAAELLGISRRAIYNKLKKHNIL
ncbi:MAG: helix-turn-helix domain-containing protein, partial [Nitrospinales bacterium]